ncbi:MAG: hypothetical protein FDZ70_07475 [Actinobacteria bacterium]|nr:MAG: hypothetical protein FDZ70_07475 [Actinomycetota bacterium]
MTPPGDTGYLADIDETRSFGRVLAVMTVLGVAVFLAQRSARASTLILEAVFVGLPLGACWLGWWVACLDRGVRIALRDDAVVRITRAGRETALTWDEVRRFDAYVKSFEGGSTLYLGPVDAAGRVRDEWRIMVYSSALLAGRAVNPAAKWCIVELAGLPVDVALGEGARVLLDLARSAKDERAFLQSVVAAMRARRFSEYWELRRAEAGE